MANKEPQPPLPEMMILRFRDLSTNPGETVRLHREKISEGYAWWGWWKKAGEKVPEDTFRAMLQAKDAEGIPVMLFDTGEGKLYEATIEDVRWDSRLTPGPPPEPERTPDYYAGRVLLAWFKMTSLGKELEEATLKNWSYLEVDEIFKSPGSAFSVFTSKKVASFEELRHQERTVWFLRQSKPEDLAHEVLLHSAVANPPSNFPEKVIERVPRHILWLSDLHFSEEHHAFPLERNSVQGGSNLSEALRKDLEGQGIADLGGVLVSGDLTWAGLREEYELVESFLKDVQSWATLDPGHILVCPGNHDLAFTDEPWTKGKLIPRVTPEATKQFADFYRSLYGVHPNEFLASGRRFLLGGSTVVEIVSLNSSYLQQTAEAFQGQGYVGERQRDAVDSGMRWDNSRLDSRPLRIAMLHHHVVPILPQELAKYERASSVLYDSGALCNWFVKRGVDLVLHGHMHHTKVIRESRSKELLAKQDRWHDFIVASLASTGVGIDDNPIDRKNVYGLLEFHGDRYHLRVREIRAQDGDQAGGEDVVNLEFPTLSQE